MGLALKTQVERYHGICKLSTEKKSQHLALATKASGDEFVLAKSICSYRFLNLKRSSRANGKLEPPPIDCYQVMSFVNVCY